MSALLTVRHALSTVHQTTAFRMCIVLFLGFASGLPLGLTGTTLQAWYAADGINIKTIGFVVALVGQPYAFKFFWAPAIDKWQWASWGRYKVGIVVMQLLMIGLLCQMAMYSPIEHSTALLWVAFGVAFASATQDIAIDAYRTELLPTDERGLGSAFAVTGYRLAMIVSGGVALFLADSIGFQKTYLIMACCLSVGVIAIVMAPNLYLPKENTLSWGAAIVEPFKKFLSKPQALSLLLLVVLYKLGDAFAGILTTTFLLRDLNLSLTEVGWLNKIVGLIATITGALLGGWWLKHLRLYQALMIFGILQTGSNLLYSLLAMTGHQPVLTASAIAVENLCGGMGTAAFLAFIMALCDKGYTATQFALLTALSAVGRIYVGPVAGIAVEQIGWSLFFLSSAFVSLPGLALLVKLKSTLLCLDQEKN